MARECWIVGPPGTGKTTTVVEQVRRAVSVVGADAILVCTHTRAAAGELLSRGMPIGKKQVGTIHAHAYRALGCPKVLTGDGASGKKFLEKTGVDPHALAWGCGPTGTPRTLLDATSLCRATLRPPKTWPAMITRFAAAWNAYKTENDLLDFSDLIEQAYLHCPTAPGAPAAIFVDEAQDSAPDQWRLLRKWGDACGHSFVLVGDPDQTLYQWTGASPVAMTLAAGARCHSRVVLRQSYRVPRAVHALAQRVTAGIAIRDPAEYAPRDADGSVRRFNGAYTTRRGRFRDYGEIADTIQRELANHDGTVLVLTQCGYQLDPLLTVLRERRAAWCNPLRADPRWNPLANRKGVIGALLALKSLVDGTWKEKPSSPPARARGEDEPALPVDDDDPFAPWPPDPRPDPPTQEPQAAPGSTFPVALVLAALAPLRRGAFKQGGVAAFEDVPGEDAATATWNDLSTFLGAEQTARLRAVDLDWYCAHAVASATARAAYLAGVIRRDGWAALLVPPRLMVGTVHSVKGGEADTVIYLQGSSPATMRAVIDGTRETADAVRRVLYVAATRARERLVIVGNDRYAAVGVPEL